MSNIRNVALLGADGKLGPAILSALAAASFTVTVLKRQSSSQPDSNYPFGVKVSRIPDDMAEDGLVEALRGNDALVVTIKGSLVEPQERLARACVKAGVRRMVPADFGSVDSASEWTQSLVPLYKHKTALREKLITLASENSGKFTWTSLVCGHFFDWSPEFLHVYPEEKRIDILDDGENRWSASTLSQIGNATASILRHPDETANKIVYVQSFLISQNDVLRALEKASGSKWTVQKFESKKYEVEEKKKADGGDLEAVENLVWMLGALDADWTDREGFAMKTLGLKEEDLDEVVKGMVAEWRKEGRM